MIPLASRSLCRALAFVSALGAASITAAPARAGLGAEGEPAFGISGYFNSPPKLNQAITLQIRVWGENDYEAPATSVARISIPEGIRIISGDTVSVARVDRGTKRRPERVILIVIRPERYGTYLIRGSLKIDGGEERGIDETDFYLPLTIESDRVSYARAPRSTRYEHVRHGQRYRYGGRYLVPIDSTQALLEEEITEKARPTVQEAATCHTCPGPLPTVVPFVAMVGSDGRLRESRFLDIQEQGTTDPALVAAASDALSRWEFEPARANDLPVADFVVVRVPIHDGQP
jgi:hypothetical protein